MAKLSYAKIVMVKININILFMAKIHMDKLS
jgi:hypothetical protein